jgi:hypothetical protein
MRGFVVADDAVKPTKQRRKGRGDPSVDVTLERIARQKAEVCERIAKGETLSAICRSEGFPDPVTVWRWKEIDDQFAQDFARARELGYDAIADETVRIADDASNDYMESKRGGKEFDAEHVQRSKLRVETRLKLLAKWSPKKYGEKVVVGGDEDSPVQVVTRVVLVAAKNDNG